MNESQVRDRVRTVLGEPPANPGLASGVEARLRRPTRRPSLFMGAVATASAVAIVALVASPFVVRDYAVWRANQRVSPAGIVKSPSQSTSPSTLPTGPGPSGCKGAAAAFDIAADRLVVVGGDCLSGGPTAQTWAYANGRWTQLVSATGPAWRYDASMAFDPLSNAVILFGGTARDTTLLSDTWRLDSNGWTQVNVQGPGPREGAALGLDGVSGHLMLFGGARPNGRATTALADQWFWNGSSWSAGPSLPGPPGRIGAALTFDPQMNATMLYGGNNAAFALGDMWAWSGAGWTQVAANPAPPGRAYAGLAFDANSKALILFGGQAIAQGLDDTWEYQASSWKSLSSATGPPAALYANLIAVNSSGKLLLFDATATKNGATNSLWSWDGSGWRELWVSD